MDYDTDEGEGSVVEEPAAKRMRQWSPVRHLPPPAPPSTPASLVDKTLPTDLSSPTISSATYEIQNAAALEQAQRMQEMATPAPTPKPKSSKTAGSADEFSEWAVGDRYQLIRMLGRGSYGEVAQAKDKVTDDTVAIKRITSAFEQEVDAIRLYREIHILRRLRGHECIIQLLDVVQPPNFEDFHDLYLVFEYVDTDLYKLIMSPQYLTTEHIQMLAGLKFIHSSSVIHRDLKPANILLNEDCSLKICDFGLARIVDAATMSTSAGVGDVKRKSGAKKVAPPKRGLTRQLTKHVVTRWYRAPELILVQPYTSAVDMWSLGCILAELLSMQDGNGSYQDRKPLFPGGSCYPLSGKEEKEDRLDQLSVILGVIGTPKNLEGASSSVPPQSSSSSPKSSSSPPSSSEYLKQLRPSKGTPFEKLFPSADPDAIDLLKCMLQFHPQDRCTAQEALDHCFFKSVRKQDMEKEGSALEAPDFLDVPKVDLNLLKKRTYEEVLWYQEHNAKVKKP